MWKFEACNIGKVKHAEISMTPFVLFVGRNNTGKSYIATLLWALRNAQSLIFRPDVSARRPKWFKDLEGRINKLDTFKFTVDEDYADDLIEYFNEELRSSAQEMLEDVFAYSGFDQATVSVQRFQPFEPFEVNISSGDPVESDKRRMFIRVAFGTDKPVRFFVRPKFPGILNPADRVFIEIFYRVLFGRKIRRPTIYIPAARTGLMLSLRAMISQLFDDDSPQSSTLPKPLKDFVRLLTYKGGKEKNETGQIIDWLEKEIMHGRIEVHEEELRSFSYTPENTKLSLPLHATSSMITELAPVVILLKDGFSPGQLIFEEPEAHLHLSAQRVMARALARLVNSGVDVLVTTHSDTFVQQINNLMHLFAHPERADLMARMGYEDSDLIDPDKAKAYEFCTVNEITNVSEVKKEKEGFVVRSLNDTLTNLAEETIKLQEDQS